MTSPFTRLRGSLTSPVSFAFLLVAGVCLASSACSFDSMGAAPGTVFGASAAGSGGAAGSGASSGASTGGAGGTGGMNETVSSGSGGSTSFFPYAFRRRIHIQAQASALPSDYSIVVPVDHLSLVGQSKALPTGDDVRIFRDDGGMLTEVDRVLDPVSSWNGVPTFLWFRTNAPIDAAAVDESYWIYYGNSAATDPPADGNRVYLIWNDFDDGIADSNGFTLSLIGGAKGAATESGSDLLLSVSSGDIWDQADSFAFLHHEVSGDFVADTLVSSMGGTLGGWSKMGGLMIRQTTDAQSRNRIMSPVFTQAARTNSYRLADNASTDEVALPGMNSTPEFARVTRMGSRSRAFYSKDGMNWVENGTEITFSKALTDPVLIGIPACNLDSQIGTVTVGWIRVRKLVESEPIISVLAEEMGPF